MFVSDTGFWLMDFGDSACAAERGVVFGIAGGRLVDNVVAGSATTERVSNVAANRQTTAAGK